MATLSGSAASLARRELGGRNARGGFGRSMRLSGQELTVLRALARGASTEEIAEFLVVSPHTVRTHVKNGMRKLGARTRAQAVAIALSEGAVRLDSE